jgi:hypothetical protein
MSASPRRPRDASSVRLVTVSEDEEFRRRTRTSIRTLPGVWCAGEAAEAVSAEIVCLLAAADVVVMDCALPRHDAGNLVLILHAAMPATHIIACGASGPSGMVAVPLTFGEAGEDHGGDLAIVIGCVTGVRASPPRWPPARLAGTGRTWLQLCQDGDRAP